MRSEVYSERTGLCECYCGGECIGVYGGIVLKEV